MWKKIAIWIGWILSAAALAYLVYRLAIYDNYDAFWQSLAKAGLAGYTALCIAILFLPVQLLIETRKWQTLLIGLTNIDFKSAWWQVIYGNVAAFVTPYRLGEYPGRIIELGVEDISSVKSRIFDGNYWKDWRKWLRVLLLHLARYIVWMLQLWAVLTFCLVNAFTTSLSLLCRPFRQPKSRSKEDGQYLFSLTSPIISPLSQSPSPSFGS